jgi:hypothetical protein
MIVTRAIVDITGSYNIGGLEVPKFSPCVPSISHSKT